MAKLRVIPVLRSYAAMPWISGCSWERLLSQCVLEPWASMSMSVGLQFLDREIAGQIGRYRGLAGATFGIQYDDLLHARRRYRANCPDIRVSNKVSICRESAYAAPRGAASSELVTIITGHACRC